MADEAETKTRNNHKIRHARTPCCQWKGETKQGETECETEPHSMVKGDGRVSTAALRVLSDSALMSFSKHHRHWGLQSVLVVHTAFKTVSNAIELAMIASSTALTRACKQEGSED